MSQAPEQTATPEVEPAADAPVGVEPKKKKKKKKYSNKNMRRMEKADRNMSKANRRLAKAIARGIENWEENRDKAAWKRKDGAFMKAAENSAQAFGTFLREASYIPEEITKGQKLVRRMVPFNRK
eukprot:TRINITY_DN4874_c1_g2_i1.p2 TRINITY_DN4874_c1_g2~~TRINITY_DN4874_c1_g2_i1.p2  ORF type:complete len:125 (+),score=25.20 TRINITY_DN4874_c1_g2_i1:215-589(+)